MRLYGLALGPDGVVVAGPDPSLLSQPSNAILKALGRDGLTPGDMDLFEINEAFASVAIQSMRDLDLSPDIVRVNGGAIAMGHPVGASGARLALELGRRGGGQALVTGASAASVIRGEQCTGV